jgi:nucleoporin NUP1
MFKPRKVHQIVPMHKGKDKMPRLGTAERKKKRQKDESGKPYTGQGGMKKLLARRKLEAEEEKKEKSEAMMTDGVNAEPMVTKTSEETVSVDVAAVPVQEPTVQQHRVNGRETSSLRVGRTRISRQHIERPGSTKPSKNRFSAVYDDEDSMDQTGDMEETPKSVPIFEVPKAFSCALEVRFIYL